MRSTACGCGCSTRPTSGPARCQSIEISLDTNGAVATFDGIAGDKVWIAAAFDEKGAMMGDGPPPSGSPIGVLVGSDGAPNGVAPGGKDAVAMTFDDTVRMP